MYYKLLYFAVVACLLLYGDAEGKKTKKNKRTKTDKDDTTPQPSVVAYSTFGFNDVGPYDGFVPSSPDYANYLSNINQESTTRLYAPAFPTASDTAGFNNNYDYQHQDGQSFSSHDDNTPQSSMLHYAQSPMNLVNTPELENVDDRIKNNPFHQMHGRITDELNSPVYGTKLNAREKDRAPQQFNHSEPAAYIRDQNNSNDEKYTNYYNNQPTDEIKQFGESSVNHQAPQTYESTFSSNEFEHFPKPNSFKFPKLIDFTKMNQFYAMDVDNNKFTTTSPKPPNIYNPFPNVQTENTYKHTHEDFTSKVITPTPVFKNTYEYKTKYFNEEVTERNVPKFSSDHDQYHGYDSSSTQEKYTTPSIKMNPEHKKKMKKKPWQSHNYTDGFKNWKDPFSTKGYEYATNFSKTSFQFGVSEPKKPFGSFNNVNELEPASSNLIDLSNYQFPDTDYSSFKKIPDVKFNDEEDFTSSYKDKFRSPDYASQYSNIFSTIPTTTSYWENSFKLNDFYSLKKYPKKNHYSDEFGENVVNITPKRPSKMNAGRPSDSKDSWFNPNHRPYRLFKPSNDWPQESGGRYASEEDLLDLRNHDTSHPSYLPTYKYHKDEDNDFKKVVDKWRQSYLKSKYKNYVGSDFESYASEPKQMHVPIPKPYPIEIPHPVIIPVPQPYPVRVPVAKPVAVPVLKELTIPIEKPVPYPVVKAVPYPVEKLVPVHVEKEVKVPVEKPYPVAVPYMRPVFHHTKGSHDENESDHGDDNYKPDSNRYPTYRKRPTRNRSRRPTRNSYQDRNRRRWPDKRQPSPSSKESRFRRPPPEYSSPYKHRDFDPEGYDDDRSEYISRCKRNRDC